MTVELVKPADPVVETAPDTKPVAPLHPPVQSVVDLLEGLIERAEAGEIVTIGICAVQHDGAPMKAHAGTARDLAAVAGDLWFELMDERATAYHRPATLPDKHRDNS